MLISYPQPYLRPFERLATLAIPSLELMETEDAVVVSAYLPGVDPRHAQVQVCDRTLTLSGQQQRYLRHGYRYTLDCEQFQHTIPLPVAVDDSQVQLAFKADRLIVTLPKKQHNRPGLNLSQRWARFKAWLGDQLERWGHQLQAHR